MFIVWHIGFDRSGQVYCDVFLTELRTSRETNTVGVIVITIFHSVDNSVGRRTGKTRRSGCRRHAARRLVEVSQSRRHPAGDLRRQPAKVTGSRSRSRDVTLGARLRLQPWRLTAEWARRDDGDECYWAHVSSR